MIILAVYYTIADIVLLLQCFYYRGFTWRDEVIPPKPTTQIGEPTERTGLLSPSESRRPSASHLSPAVPLLSTAAPVPKPRTTYLQATLFNLFAVTMVIAAGVFGWWISNRSQSSLSPKPTPSPSPSSEEIVFSLWGQIFGYLCALLYLGSRIPQMLLNYRRKSTEGVSMLFFLFACLGNLTYVLSIFAYDARCSGKHGRCADGERAAVYWRYIGVNASWLAGSLGTLFLDLAIFAQFFLYRETELGIDDEVVVGSET